MPTPSPKVLNGVRTRTYPKVALLDEHVRRGDDGQVILTVDEPYLQKLAARGNARVRRTKDYAPIVLGHTLDGETEVGQPAVVGGASDYVVDDFAPDPDTGRMKKAVFADVHVYEHLADEVEEKYPRRSVELWVERGEIDPIALLGATTPERDLGPLLKLSRGGGLRYRYSLNSPLSPGATVPDPVADAEQTETAGFKALEAKIDKLATAFEKFLTLIEGDAGGDAPPADDDDLLGPDPDADAHEDDLPADEPPPAKPDEEPVKLNRRTPTPTPRDPMPTRPTDDVLKLQRTTSAQAKEIETLRLKLSRADAEKAVAKLRQEGYEFADADEDVAILTHLGTESKEGQKHLSRIKLNYRRGVVGASEDDLLDNAEEGHGTLTRAKAQEIAARAARGEVKYEDEIARFYKAGK